VDGGKPIKMKQKNLEYNCNNSEISGFSYQVEVPDSYEDGPVNIL
jgi:hypothetical protein